MMTTIEILKAWPIIVTSAATLVGGMGLGGMLKAWLDYKRGVRKDTDDMATAIVAQLSARVEAVETSAAQERTAAQNERALCDANLAVLRHRMNNLSSSFDGLLMMIEMAPDKAGEIVARVKEKRAQQELAEATEKAAVLAMVAAQKASTTD